jgi:hypothetical protein
MQKIVDVLTNCISLMTCTVLGFGVNLVTVVMISVIVITQRSARQNWRVGPKLYFLSLVV